MVAAERRLVDERVKKIIELKNKVEKLICMVYLQCIDDGVCGCTLSGILTDCLCLFGYSGLFR